MDRKAGEEQRKNGAKVSRCDANEVRENFWDRILFEEGDREGM